MASGAVTAVAERVALAVERQHDRVRLGRQHADGVRGAVVAQFERPRLAEHLQVDAALAPGQSELLRGGVPEPPAIGQRPRRSRIARGRGPPGLRPGSIIGNSARVPGSPENLKGNPRS